MRVVPVDMPMSRALLPSREVLDGRTVLGEAVSWGGVDDGLARAMFRQLGDPGLSSMQILAVLPNDVLKNAMFAATRGGRALSSIEVAQLALTVNAIKVKFGAPAFSLEEPRLCHRRQLLRLVWAQVEAPR